MWTVPHAATADPAMLLAEARIAAGGDAWTRVASLTRDATETESGLTGPVRLTVDRATGQYSEITDFGSFRQGAGIDAAGAWVLPMTGAVHPLDGAEARAVTTAEAWLLRRGYLDPRDRATYVEETREADGVTWPVLRATPPGGRGVALWLDPATHLVRRATMQRSISLLSIRYDDYRTVEGVALPFRETSDIGDPSDLDVTEARAWTVSRDPVTPPPRPTPPSDSRMSDSGASTTVPLLRNGDELLVEARIDGHAPLAFVLDTGGHAILSAEAARELGVGMVGHGVTYGAGEGSAGTRFAHIGRVDIGAAELDDIPFLVIDEPYQMTERGKATPVAGILGLEVFSRFAVRLDYARNEITLTPLASFDGNASGQSIPFTFDDDIPLVEGALDGHPGVIAIDTGNGSDMIVQGRFARATGLDRFFESGLPVVSFGQGGVSRNMVARLRELSLGPVAIDAPLSRVAYDAAGAFSSRSEAANVGQHTLSRFVVTFDYRRQRMTLDPILNAEPPVFPRAGLQLRKESPEAFTVVSVIPGGPANAAHLTQGEHVTRIDDTSARDLSGADALEKMRQPVGTKLALTLGDGRAVTLVLRDLIP